METAHFPAFISKNIICFISKGLEFSLEMSRVYNVYLHFTIFNTRETETIQYYTYNVKRVL